MLLSPSSLWPTTPLAMGSVSTNCSLRSSQVLSSAFAWSLLSFEQVLPSFPHHQPCQGPVLESTHFGGSSFWWQSCLPCILSPTLCLGASWWILCLPPVAAAWPFPVISHISQPFCLAGRQRQSILGWDAQGQLLQERPPGGLPGIITLPSWAQTNLQGLTGSP